MKGLIQLAVLILFLDNLCVAQTEYVDKKFSFGYNYGTSAAQGDFGANSNTKLPVSRNFKPPKDTTQLNGYAKNGFHYDIYATYEFIPHISAMLSVSGDQYNFDIRTLSTEYGQFYSPNSYYVTTGDNYYAVQYLAGLYLNPRIVGSLHF